MDATIERYCGAVYRYLLGATRDEDVAEELFQEFALRFLRGDFANVRPERGRFRSYLKTVLINMVNDLHRERHRRASTLPLQHTAQEEPNHERMVIDGLREELIEQTWRALAESHPAYYAVLSCRAANPDSDAQSLAIELRGPLGRACTPGHIRTLLHRAREQFAKQLLLEVANTCETRDDSELMQELRTLRLVRLCESAMRRRH